MSFAEQPILDGEDGVVDRFAELLAELKQLRKGRGVYAPQIENLVGPGLRSVCAITDEDDRATIRQKMVERLGALADTLPGDLGLATSAALAIHPHARQAFLSERIQWLAGKICRDERTARRRMDDGIVHLAEAATRQSSTVSRLPPKAGDAWYVEEFNAVLLLDRASPQAIERRRIVAEQDDLAAIQVAVSLPQDPTDPSSTWDLLAEVLYGGILVAKEHPTASRFQFDLKLPRALRAGERHEYAMIFRVPERQPMRPHYVFVSPRRCDLFDLRIRFDRERLPQRVWRVSRLFHREVDEIQHAGEVVTPDAAGDLHLQFSDLAPGFGYGAQWSSSAG